MVRENKRLSTTGVQIDAGVPYTEHNPNLQPFDLRGVEGSIGLADRYARHPTVYGTIARTCALISNRSWRLNVCEIPQWMKGDSELEASVAEQGRFYSMVWHRWQTPNPDVDEPAFRAWIREAVLCLERRGLYVAEITSKVYKFRGRQIRIPDLPRYIAPSSIIAWNFDLDGENDRLNGIWLRPPVQTNYMEGFDTGEEIFVPFDRLLVMSRFRIGPNPEGESAIRPVMNIVDFHQMLLEIEAMAAERHSNGELFLKQDPITVSSVSDDDLKLMSEYIKNRGKGPNRNNGAVLPKGFEPHMVAPTSQMPNLTPIQTKYEWIIRETMGAEDRGMAQKGGSYAARDGASDDYKQQLDDACLYAVVEPLSRVMMRYCLRNNLAEDELYLVAPNILFSTVVQDDPLEKAKVVKDCFEKGMFPSWSLRDEDHLRDLLNMPSAEVKDAPVAE